MGLLHKGKQMISEKNTSEKNVSEKNSYDQLSDAHKPAFQQSIEPQKMGQKQYQIHTPLDSLYELVQEQKSVSLEQASLALQLPPQTIEVWGTLLDKAGLIAFVYPPFGQPSLQVKESLQQEQHDTKTH